MTLEFRAAIPEDAGPCIEMRGKTRENAYSATALAAIGITLESWCEGIRNKTSPGFVCLDDERIVGMCFWDSPSGEVLVVAVLPEYENLGIGRNLLQRSLAEIEQDGHKRSFLGCNPNSNSRSYGFYRKLGWVTTGTTDSLGDEILEIALPHSKLDIQRVHTQEEDPR